MGLRLTFRSLCWILHSFHVWGITLFHCHPPPQICSNRNRLIITEIDNPRAKARSLYYLYISTTTPQLILSRTSISTLRPPPPTSETNLHRPPRPTSTDIRDRPQPTSATDLHQLPQPTSADFRYRPPPTSADLRYRSPPPPPQRYKCTNMWYSWR